MPFRKYTTVGAPYPTSPLAPSIGAPSARSLAARALAPTRNTARRDFGGFPTPLNLAGRVAERVAPGTFARLERTLTLPPPGGPPQGLPELLRDRKATLVDRVGGVARSVGATDEGMGGGAGQVLKQRKMTVVRKDTLDSTVARKGTTAVSIASARPTSPAASLSSSQSAPDWADDIEEGMEKVVNFFKREVAERFWVGRNSFFHLAGLTEEELEEVGGVEYGAIRVLSWLVPAVSIFCAYCDLD